MEKRLLLAFVLSALIFAVWSVVFPPPAPPMAVPQEEVVSETVTGVVESTPAERIDAEAAIDAAPAEEALSAVAGEIEQTIRLANAVMEVELNNRGAMVTSMRLLHFEDDEGAILDLIQTIPNDDRAMPLQLMTEGVPETRNYRDEPTNYGALK